MKHSPAMIRPPATKPATLRERRTRDRLNLRDRLASAALFLCGLALLLTVPGARVGGALMAIIGGAILGRDMRREILAALARRRFEAVQAQRAVKRQARRERGLRERELQQQKQQQARTVQERRFAARTAAREEARLLHQREEDARAQRDAWLQNEADRFVSMDDSTLQAELAHIFAARGLTAHEAPGRLRSRSASQRDRWRKRSGARRVGGSAGHDR